MSEPIIHWNILPKYLGIYLFKWMQDNPPTVFLRRDNHTMTGRGFIHRPSLKLTEAGRADLEEYKQKG